MEVTNYCKKKKSKSIIYKEKANLTETKKFIARIIKIRDKCKSFIQREIKKGKTVMVYGASTKGNTILQFFGLDNKLIRYAAERTPQKWGKYTVGTGIKIISEREARKLNPDYFFCQLPLLMNLSKESQNGLKKVENLLFHFQILE